MVDYGTHQQRPMQWKRAIYHARENIWEGEKIFDNSIVKQHQLHLYDENRNHDNAIVWLIVLTLNRMLIR